MSDRQSPRLELGEEAAAQRSQLAKALARLVMRAYRSKHPPGARVEPAPPEGGQRAA